MDIIPWLGRFVLLGLLYLFLAHVLHVVAADLAAAVPASRADASPAERRSPLLRRLRGALPAPGRLEVITSAGVPAPGTRFAVTDQARIGRTPPSEILLPDAHVSGEHARLYFRDRRYWIEDLRSTNGTLLNGRPLTTPRPLEEGDQIGLGPVLLRFTRRAGS